jgi:hypothetical protein
MPSTDKHPTKGLAADAEAAGMSLPDYIRACGAQWDADHPEEVEASRLRAENARLQQELNRVTAMEAEAKRRREANVSTTISLAVYFGGIFVRWLIFGNACPSCAYNGTPHASWWDFLSMFALLGWGIGGLFAGNPISHWLRSR